MKKVLVSLVVLMAVIVPSLGFAQDDDIPVYNDPAMTTRLDRAGAVVNLGVQKLQAENPKLWQGRLRFRVYDDEELNARAYPDGRIYVYRGAMEMLTDTDLIAILNHEATHVIQKHGRAQTKKNVLWRIGTLLLGRAVGASADTADTASQIATGIAAGGYSRKDERRADDGSVDLCIVEGIDPYAPAKMMKKLQDKYGDGSAKALVIGWFATHDNAGDRVKRLTERAKSYIANPTSEVGVVGQSNQPPASPTRVIYMDFYGDVPDGFGPQVEVWTGQSGKVKIVPKPGGEIYGEIVEAKRVVLESGEYDTTQPSTPKRGKMTPPSHYFRMDVKREVRPVYGAVSLPVGKANVEAGDYVRVIVTLTVRPYNLTTGEPEDRGGYVVSGDAKGLQTIALYVPGSSVIAGGIHLGNYEETLEGRAAKTALFKFIDLLAPSAVSTAKPAATGTIVKPPSNPDRIATFALYIKPHPHENKMEPRKVNFSAPWSAVQAADYLLFIRGEKVAAKINIDRTSETEVWGTIEYPYLYLLNTNNIQKVQLMKSD